MGYRFCFLILIKIYWKNKFLILKEALLIWWLSVCNTKLLILLHKHNLWGLISFGRFEGSKFDLREQTFVPKIQCLRSYRFGISRFVPCLAFIMYQFVIGKLTSLFTQPLYQSCIFITRSIKSCTFIEHYSLISICV